MRTLLLIALALAAVAVGVVTLRMGDGPGDQDPGLPELRSPSGARPPAASSRAASSALVAPEIAAADPAPALEGSPAGFGGPRALEGLVRDRFGNPLRERVLLLAERQAHPSEGADLTQFITAVSSREGLFSLTLPEGGPDGELWRLGVGAPGAPRLAPTEPRALDGSQRAEVVLAGSAALAVVFEERLADEPVTIDLVTLRENESGERGRGEGRRGGDRSTTPRSLDRGGSGRGSGDRGTSLRDAGGRGGPREDVGEEEGSGDRRGAALAPAAALSGRAWASPARRALQDLDLQSSGRGRRGSGARPQQRPERVETPVDSAAQDDAPTGPPPEVWRSQERRTLGAEELAAGRVEFAGLTPGPVARLILSVGGERYEGVARFAFPADARVEVRVLPFVPGSGTLTYLTSTTPLAPDENPAGVTWVE